MGTQLTISEYFNLKNEIRDKLQEIQVGFIEVGYRLKVVRDSGLYIQDGYKDVYEFAQAEFGLGKSSVSKFIKVNDNFSIGGNSQFIQEQYKAIGYSKLYEILALPEEDRELVTDKTTVAEIREIRQFNEDEEELMPTPMENYMNPPEIIEPTQQEDEATYWIKETIKVMFENKKLEDTFNNLIWIKDFSLEFEDIVEEIVALSPSVIRNGRVMLFINNLDQGVKGKIMGISEKSHFDWEEFLDLIRETFKEYVGQPNTWRRVYGSNEVVEEKPKDKKEEQKAQKEKAKEQLKPKKEKVEEKASELPTIKKIDYFAIEKKAEEMRLAAKKNDKEEISRLIKEISKELEK